MAGVNKVILIGNLGSDPEVRHLSTGSVVANFNIATSESYTNKSGEKVTQTEWHRIELWDGLAKVAEQYLKKGNTVYVEGKLRTENWQDNDGNSRTTIRIRATNMNLLGGRNPEAANHQVEQSSPERSDERPTQVSSSAPPVSTGTDTDDLPF
jgi:single-strand DNA-binding protein